MVLHWQFAYFLVFRRLFCSFNCFYVAKNICCAKFGIQSSKTQLKCKTARKPNQIGFPQTFPLIFNKNVQQLTEVSWYYVWDCKKILKSVPCWHCLKFMAWNGIVSFGKCHQMLFKKILCLPFGDFLQQKTSNSPRSLFLKTHFSHSRLLRLCLQHESIVGRKKMGKGTASQIPRTKSLIEKSIHLFSSFSY